MPSASCGTRPRRKPSKPQATACASIRRPARGRHATGPRADAATTQAIVEASRAVDADIEIPLSDRARELGFNYFGFQRGGIKFCSERPATLLADDMGVGKTIQIIGAANVTKARRILIVCPASMLFTWGKELHVWLVEQLHVSILTTSIKPRLYIGEQVEIVNAFPSDPQVVVTHRRQHLLWRARRSRGHGARVRPSRRRTARPTMFDLWCDGLPTLLMSG